MADLGADGRIYQLNKKTTLDNTHAFVVDKDGETEADRIEYSDLLALLKAYFDLIYTLTLLGGVPTSRTVNSKALTANISLTASDVGAAEAGHNHSGTYAPAANGVTNGDSHNHDGGDGAQIAYSALSGVPSTFAPASHNNTAHSETYITISSVTKAAVGLSNVTNDAQVKKITSSTDNQVMRWDGNGGDTPQGSQMTIDDSGSPNIPSGQSYKINNSALNCDDISDGSTYKKFSATEQSKLSGIEASADVTDATNVTAAGALMDSECASLADVKALNQSVVSGASPTFSTANMTDAENKRLMTDAQESKLDAVKSMPTGDIVGTTDSQTITTKTISFDSNTLSNHPEAIGVACSDETTALTTGTAKATFRMPFAMTLTAVRATLSTAQASGDIFTVDINEGGNTILSTKITIDNTEKTSTTAVTAAVISDSALADDAEITIDIDQIGDGTAKGLKVWLIGKRA